MCPVLSCVPLLLPGQCYRVDGGGVCEVQGVQGQGEEAHVHCDSSIHMG